MPNLSVHLPVVCFLLPSNQLLSFYEGPSPSQYLEESLGLKRHVLAATQRVESIKHIALRYELANGIDGGGRINTGALKETVYAGTPRRTFLSCVVIRHLTFFETAAHTVVTVSTLLCDTRPKIQSFLPSSEHDRCTQLFDSLNQASHQLQRLLLR